MKHEERVFEMASQSRIVMNKRNFHIKLSAFPLFFFSCMTGT